MERTVQVFAAHCVLKQSSDIMASLGTMLAPALSTDREQQQQHILTPASTKDALAQHHAHAPLQRLWGSKAHTYRLALTYAHIHAHIEIHTHAHTYTHTNTNAHEYLQAHTHTYTCTRTNTQTHARAHKQTHKHTGTHTHKHARTHTLTHTCICMHMLHA
jgi:hypothetical protein